MFKKTKKVYIFEQLQKDSGVIHAFSSKEQANQEEFLKALGLNRKDLVLMEQVHGRRVKWIGGKDKGKVIAETDGLATDQPGIVLGVKTADCQPLLFYDPVRKIIAAVHAGWRGVLVRIAQRAVDLLILKGSLPENILVFIGPAIGSCCYSVEPERAKRFLTEFGDLPGMTKKKGKKVFLDIMIPTVNQLVHSGVLKSNIFSAAVCTAESDQFFSHRAAGGSQLGSMLAIIGLR